MILAMAEEMGISMDRFDVVRRAMALAAHSSDNTPALAGTVRLLVTLSSICLFILFYFITSYFVSFLHVCFYIKINED
jgi:hypothetical protein